MMKKPIVDKSYTLREYMKMLPELKKAFKIFQRKLLSDLENNTYPGVIHGNKNEIIRKLKKQTNGN